jgi:hypothetical protein
MRNLQSREANSFSYEAQHDYVVPEPYLTLAILLLLPMFSLDWCGLLSLPETIPDFYTVVTR